MAQPKSFETDLTPRNFLAEMHGSTKCQTASSMQEYFLVAANDLISLHNWHGAAQFLENLLSYPTKSNTMSGSMLDAYKKWVLVQLMLDGKLPKQLPKMVNQKMAETFHTMAAPYEAVANLFESGTIARLQEEVSAGAKKWAEEGNTALMRLVLESYQERRILGMSSIFTTVPISYIATAIGSSENGDPTDCSTVIELINAMIQRSQLHGKLMTDSNGQTFLCFDESQHPQDEVMARQLPATVAGVKALMEDVRGMSQSIVMDKDYVKWVSKQTKNSGAGGAQSMMMDESAWQVGPDDEDLMAN